MGVFSSTPKTYVSSTVYNMAGDEDLRPNFLATATVGATLSGSKEGMGKLLFNAHAKGPIARQKRFFRWAQNNWFAMPDARIAKVSAVDGAAAKSGIESLITLGSGQSLRVIAAVIDDADIDYWAEDYIRQNHPTLTELDWAADFDELTNEVVIQVPTGEERFAAPADLLWGLERDQERRLFFASYEIYSTNEAGEITNTSEHFLTYRMGSGNVALDGLGSGSVAMSEFYPALPLRLNNQSVTAALSASELATLRKGYRKLTGRSLDDLLAQVEDNEQLDEIDFAFVVQGISLNVKEKDCKAYLYSFLEELIQQQQVDETAYDDYVTKLLNRDQDHERWKRWHRANNGDRGNDHHPLYGTPAPEAVGVSTLPDMNELKIMAPGQPEFDFRVRWAYAEEIQGVGNAKTFDNDQSRGKLKVGDYWFHVGEDVIFKKFIRNPYGGEGGESLGEFIEVDHVFNTVHLFHQYAPYLYRQIKIVGLEHRNYVYNNKAVIITGKEALEDEEESGFLIPLHYPTLKGMGIFKGTQLTTANTFIVFNSYKVVKKKWYQRGFFRILLVIVIAVVSVVFPPAASAAFATGTAMGLTGTAAIIAGAIANGITAMVVSQVVMAGATKLFGEKIGAIVGTIATFVVMQYAATYAQTGTMNVDWSQVMRVDNIMQLTDSVSEAYVNYLNADTMEIYGEIGELGSEYAEEMQRIEDLTKEVLGMTTSVIDPMMLTDAVEYFPESSETFLNRTLMTGSDIIELTHAMIENFADISLELPKAKV